MPIKTAVERYEGRENESRAFKCLNKKKKWWGNSTINPLLYNKVNLRNQIAGTGFLNFLYSIKHTVCLNELSTPCARGTYMRRAKDAW